MEIVHTETSDWMHNILLAHPDTDIALIDIAVPGSHDAGMYILNECEAGANSCNTQTQYLSTTDQLNAGLRMFDIRPVYYNSKYYTQHATDCDGYGCKGDLISNIFSQINTFLDNHAELVILQISHFCHTSYNETGFVNLINNTFGDKIYKETSPGAVPFIHKPLKDIIPQNKNNGKVMLILEGASDSPANRANGIFTNDIIPAVGGWTNSHDLGDLKSKQGNNYAGYSNKGITLFQFSWQITQSDHMAVDCAIFPDTASIAKLAQRANLQLTPFIDSLISTGDIKKGRIPNIIYIDLADELVTQQCLKVTKLNLE